MVYFLTTIHIIVCIFLIIIVLLQSGKAADLAGAFGGMGSQTAFGPRGAATVLSKATTVSAVLFMITSIALSVYAVRRGGGSSSVLETQKTQAPAKSGQPGKTTPAAPGQPVEIKLDPKDAPGHEGHGHGPTTPGQSAPPPTPAPAAPAGPKK